MTIKKTRERQSRETEWWMITTRTMTKMKK